MKSTVSDEVEHPMGMQTDADVDCMLDYSRVDYDSNALQRAVCHYRSSQNEELH
jgi:hypothetical protein